MARPAAPRDRAGACPRRTTASGSAGSRVPEVRTRFRPRARTSIAPFVRASVPARARAPAGARRSTHEALRAHRTLDEALRASLQRV